MTQGFVCSFVNDQKWTLTVGVKMFVQVVSDVGGCYNAIVVVVVLLGVQIQFLVESKVRVHTAICPEKNNIVLA